jgi:hypothetical protein
MSAESLGTPRQPETEPQFSEVIFTLPEFIDFARGNGDEAVVIEFESVYRRRGDGVKVRMLIPNDINKSPVIETIYDTDSG